jgi:citrate/tricarballylate utilization protein
MPTVELTNLLAEAERQMTICNSCRYCEGYCAVFPAMELRREFAGGDLIYLANLCFECRDCYYACQFAPPHEFAVNIPQVFAEIRAETYQEYSWPGILGKLYRRNGLALGLITVASTVLITLLILAFRRESLFGTHTGEGAFYRVIPYAAMVIPALLIAAYCLVAFARGAYRFWRDTDSSLAGLIDFRAFMVATKDAFGLRYLKGGGVGCNYPDERFSQVRRWFHHLVFYGFLLDFASTTVAAIYDHFLDWHAPYPFISLPVLLGTVGGIMLVVGTGGLLYLKWRSDKEPVATRMLTMDVAFLVLLGLTGVTGLLLLVLRETAAMGVLLAVHLGFVAGLFLTLPYGKFAHVIYRYAALIRNALEQARA